ncbi:DUF1398 family protein [Aeromicrobium sp. CF3.5]|uniref:DUF1398 family protein n=1 Tax=Aeromicrobium sp. CF3.5 TaxID=3373078 RepID=UPI003EE7597C
MVSLQQIDDVHARLGTAELLVDYVRALAALGVTHYDSFVIDGHTEYRTVEGTDLVGPPHHDRFEIAESADPEAFHAVMAQVELGALDYTQMSSALARCGVERWSVDTAALTMAYCDTTGGNLLIEQLT